MLALQFLQDVASLCLGATAEGQGLESQAYTQPHLPQRRVKRLVFTTSLWQCWYHGLWCGPLGTKALVSHSGHRVPNHASPSLGWGHFPVTSQSRNSPLLLAHPRH